RCLGRHIIDLAASAVASPDENSCRRSGKVATTRPLAGAQAPHRALAARGHGAGAAEGAAGAMSHPSARRLWRTQGCTVVQCARLAGAARDDAVAEPADGE